MAVRRAYEEMPAHRRPDQADLPAIAARIDPWRGTNEIVRVYRKRKSSKPGDYRLIMIFGIENRALQYLVLSLLEKVVEPHPRQYLLRGGVQAAVHDVANEMAKGPVYAYELDVKDCYPSFDGKKLQELIPLPKEVIEHVITSRHLNLKGGTNICIEFGPADGHEQSTKLTTALADAARRGIPQGSAVSPIVAEIVLALSLNAVPAIGTVFAYADNVLLLAASKSNAVAMKKALWSALEGHPVGRLQPKVRYFGIGEPIDFLGHRLTRLNGKVQIAPTTDNQQKFEARVMRALALREQKKLSPRQRQEVMRDLKRYMKAWTAAFRLCDGIKQITAGLVGGVSGQHAGS
jgi:hypothetical protein